MEEYTVDSLFTFVKTTSLTDWFRTNIDRYQNPNYENEARQYAKERDVQLVVQACFKEHKTFCRIKCPINPLPVVGWFEVPSINILKKHLEALGWKSICFHGKRIFS
ncbi:MAG: hypothetical protein IJD89_05595 [Clostridia bacterium]|nr:hypothetical protein [Clostridia bacterium]